MSRPGATPIRVVIVDDHTLLRDGITEILGTVDGFDVVGEGADGDQAVTLAARYRPDVLLLDVEMPGPGAKATIRQIRQASPQTRIVVLSMHEDSVMVHDLLERGAAAYMVKSVARDELIAALRSLCRHDDVVLLQISRRTFNEMERRRSGDTGTVLSAREVEVLRLTAEALSNANIATRLGIAEGTVKRHLTNIYDKLGAVSRLDAVRKAMTAGILLDTDLRTGDCRATELTSSPPAERGAAPPVRPRRRRRP